MDKSNRVGNLLGALALAVDDAVGEATTSAAGHGGAGAAALATLVQYPGESVDALSKTLGLTSSATVRLVDRLQADGLLERRRDGRDGRAVALFVTTAGRRRAAATLAARHQALARVLSPLSDADQSALAPVLEALLQGLTTSPERGDRICRLCNLSTCPQLRCPVSQQQTLLGAPPDDPAPL